MTNSIRDRYWEERTCFCIAVDLPNDDANLSEGTRMEFIHEFKPADQLWQCPRCKTVKVL